MLALLCIPYFTKAQCSVTSTGQSPNYTVNINVLPYSITKTCNGGGYTFKVNVGYYITFSPAMPSGGLYTLQGTVNCINLPGSSNIFFDLPNNGGTGLAESSNGSSSKNDCATATPQTLGCDAISIQINGPGISNRTINCPIYSILPVQIIDFTAIANGSKVDAQWTTASETNNSHFTFEKSKDGSQFTEVATITGSGTSNTLRHYTATDNAPYDGVSYYRIRQTNYDGKTTYTSLKTVKFDPASVKWNIYPNPNSGNQLYFSGLAGNRYLELFSATGKKVFAAELKTNQILFPNLPKGIYNLKLTDKTDNSSRVLKYVRQ